ncbi:hypothetical protein [Yoonia sp.]|uniref:hypothetical protein n=1 Tax=Yoonia sp. TaxID=2212373 RepID=UPI0019F6B387|nr:hypothetical protein [Yoonia sp.]MBE0414429.1 hypothetical protein [Yoonia sp.]
MTTLTIPANDHGQIRVFATDQAIAEPTAETLEQLFGAKLDMTFIDVVRTADLGDMTLTDYIAQGYDMSPDAVDKRAVNAINGTAILILSRATSGQAETLTLALGMRHVTTYSRDVRITAPVSLPDGSAKGIIGDVPAKAPKSDARIGGMIATVALIVMFALVGLMIWVAG